MTQARRGPRMPVCGVVTQFDDDRGLGTLRADDGRSLDFHCTAVADGSRHIEAGTRVVFWVGPGHGGRSEARHVAALGPA
jgi:cold shock CspA family protein